MKTAAGDSLLILLESLSDAAARVVEFSSNMTEEEFRSNLQAQHSILFNFIQIGENATAILARYKDFVEAHGDLPWFLMNGMRNRIVHGYRELNLSVVWQTAVSEVPGLAMQIRKILADLDHP